MQQLYDRGKLLYTGPFLDNCGGIAILNVSSEAEVREILAGDPATSEQIPKTRRCCTELRQWKNLHLEKYRVVLQNLDGAEVVNLTARIIQTTRGIDLLRNLHLECVERFFWEEPVTPIKPRTFLLLIILALATWSYSFAFPAYT